MIKAGDLVTTRGQTAVYKVHAVQEDKKSADIQLFDVSGDRTTGHVIPCPTTVLNPYKAKLAKPRRLRAAEKRR